MCSHPLDDHLDLFHKVLLAPKSQGLIMFLAVGLSVHHTPNCVVCSLMCTGELGAQ